MGTPKPFNLSFLPLELPAGTVTDISPFKVGTSIFPPKIASAMEMGILTSKLFLLRE